MPVLGSLHRRFAALIPELAKFGVVGAIGSVIDLGGAAYLHGAMHMGAMTSKGLSITAATVVTYLGSRFWTFRHRVNQHVLRETLLFAALNVVGLLIAEAVIGFVSYDLDMKGALAYNGASVAGTGFGTIFRYFAYKKWVFLAEEPTAVPVRAEAGAMGSRALSPAAAGPAGPARAGGGRHAAARNGTRYTQSPQPASPVPVNHSGPPRHATITRHASGTRQGSTAHQAPAPVYGAPVDGSQASQPRDSRQAPYYGPSREHLDPAPDFF